MGVMDNIRELGKDVAKLFKDHVTLKAEVRATEKTVERMREDLHNFIDRQREDIRDLKKDFEGMRRRLSRVEGTLDSVFERSLERALIQAAREHLEEHGSIEDFAPKLLGERGRSDEAGRASAPGEEERGPEEDAS